MWAGVRARLVREHDEQMNLAWYTAMIGRAKTPPERDELMLRRPPRPNHTPDQIFGAMRQWQAAQASLH